MKYDVFISYSRKDSAIAQKICRLLDEQNPAITYFIDKHEIDGAADFSGVLANAIEDSSFVLFLGSANSYQSDYVKKEIAYTISRKGGMALFPLMLDNAELPPSLALQLSNINWRILGKDYTIEKDLVPDIRKKLQDPHAGETFEARKQRKDRKVIFSAICSFCIILAVTLYLSFRDSDAKTTAIRSSEDAAMLASRADSLLQELCLLRCSVNEEDCVADELRLLAAAAAELGEAQSIRDAYVGTEYLPLFIVDLDAKSRMIESKRDSMYAVWSNRAQDAYSFYRQVGSQSEKLLALRYADFALMIRPEDENMKQLKAKIEL